MKIGYLADCHSSHTERWVNYFKKNGHEVFVITSEINQNLDVKQYQLRGGLPIPFTSGDSAFNYVFSPYALFKVKQIFDKEKPDIVHAHYLSHYGFIAAVVNYHPLILTAWGSDVLINPNQFRILRYMVKYALKKGDIITCDAEHMVSALKNLGTKLSKIKVIYFGTNTEKFNPSKRNIKLKEKLGASNLPIIISLRNLEPLYNIETFVRSAAIVLKTIPNSLFLVVGGGSQEKFLKELAISLNISDNLKFIGSIENKKVPEYLASSDIYVSTSLSDAGLAASTAEAMACGVPVIITNFGDNKRWVTDHVNGFLFPCKDHKLLAEKIILLLKNEQDRIKFGTNNRNIIQKKLNYWKEMEKMKNIYDDLSQR